jgi:hypothetical protein
MLPPGPELSQVIARQVRWTGSGSEHWILPLTSNDLGSAIVCHAGSSSTVAPDSNKKSKKDIDRLHILAAQISRANIEKE